MEIIVKAGGMYCIVLFVFHLLFRRIFDWNAQLPRLDTLNRSIMPVLNLSLTFVFMVFAFVSLVHTDEMLSTPLGRTLLASISMLWLFRAILQVAFFGPGHWLSWAFSGFFLAGAAIYGIPAAYAG